MRTQDDFLALPRGKKVKLWQASFRGGELLDGFIKSNPFGFSSEEIEAVRSWKSGVKGTFLIVKLTKEGAIFLEEKGKDARAYLVRPLVSPFEEVLPFPIKDPQFLMD